MSEDKIIDEFWEFLDFASQKVKLNQSSALLVTHNDDDVVKFVKTELIEFFRQNDCARMYLLSSRMDEAINVIITLSLICPFTITTGSMRLYAFKKENGFQCEVVPLSPSTLPLNWKNSNFDIICGWRLGNLLTHWEKRFTK